MYNCSDILTTDTVFEEEEEQFEGDEADEYYESDGLPVMNKSTNSLPSVTPNSAKEDLRGGLGFLYPFPSGEDAAYGIPIAPPLSEINNDTISRAPPATSSPPLFFSLPLPNQFAQTHQPYLSRQLLKPSPSPLSSNGRYMRSVSSSLSSDEFYYGHHPLHMPPHSEALIPQIDTNIAYPIEEAEGYYYRYQQPGQRLNGPSTHGGYSHLEHHQYEDHCSAASLLASHPPPATSSISSLPSSPSTTSPSSTPLSMMGTGSANSSTLSKKERNRLAAERCRKKKQDLIASLSRENRLLHQRNVELTRVNHHLEQKVDYLISVLISLDPSKGALLKGVHKKAPSPSSNGYYEDFGYSNPWNLVPSPVINGSNNALNEGGSKAVPGNGDATASPRIITARSPGQGSAYVDHAIHHHSSSPS